MSAWHSKTAAQVLSQLDTSRDRGLTGAEAEERLGRYGPNVLEEGKRPGLLVRFQSALSDKALMTRLIQQIEDLSDGEQDYYCTPQPHDTGIAVIAAMSDDSRTEATEMITELLASCRSPRAV